MGKAFFEIKAGFLIVRVMSIPWESEADLTGGGKVCFEEMMHGGWALGEALQRNLVFLLAPRGTVPIQVPCRCQA